MSTMEVSPRVNIPGMPDVRQPRCVCEQCRGGRIHHWYCAICQRGPVSFQTIGGRGGAPHFQKFWFQTGGGPGLAHYACSEKCRQEYLGLLNVIPEAANPVFSNEFEPPMARGPQGAESLPTRSARALDSD